jgi:hypothetical protein
MSMWLFAVGCAVLLLAAALVARDFRQRNVSVWLASYLRHDWPAARTAPAAAGRHLLFCFVDHFEPRFEQPSYAVECARVERWRRSYPLLCAGRRDADGRGPVHTFFYPAEEYRPEHLDALTEICRAGYGEIEVHLHHHQDTAEGLRSKLRRFVAALAERHDALPRDAASGQPRWGFIHGDWALDNSHPTPDFCCGVDNELPILAAEGCYADFTLPSAPSPCQTRMINSIYYASGNPGQRKSHDTGERVQVGRAGAGDLMIIQGPLGLNWHSRRYGVIPRIENADIRTSNPPTRARVDTWVRTGVHVVGRPEWVVVKVHTHGAPERDVDVLLGKPMADMFDYLQSRYNDGRNWHLHYVSARELFNIIKAAEAGKTGDPGRYRDFVLPRPRFESMGA